MKFCVKLPTDRVDLGDEFVSGAGVAAASRAAEDAGFDALFVTEHPFPEDRWLAGGGHHALDPFVTLAVAAAATTRLRLMVNICVVPYHSPYILAKTVSTLDVLSGGRVIFGCGAGYLVPEFAAVGSSFEDRNERIEASIAAMKEAWTCDSVSVPASGATHTMLPRPMQHPYPPIWIGGNSRRAMCRAVELGDGWAPFANSSSGAARRRSPELSTVAQLASRLEQLHEVEAEVGRTLKDVMFSPVGVATYGTDEWDENAFCQLIDEYESLGVTETNVTIPAESRSEYCELVTHFGSDVLSKRSG